VGGDTEGGREELVRWLTWIGKTNRLFGATPIRTSPVRCCRPPARLPTQAAHNGPRLGLVQAGQCRRGEGSGAGGPWGDDGLGKPMAKDDCTHAAVGATPSQRARGVRDHARAASA